MTRQVRDGPTRNRATGSAGAAGRRQPDAAGVAPGLRREPLERDGQVGPALGRHQGVDLVDDQVLDGLPVRPPGLLAQQQREALGRGDQQVRRVVAELAALVGRGVPGPHADADRAGVQLEPAGDPLQRRGEVPLDVVAEAPQGRDVDAAQAGAERPGLVLAEEPVEDRQERGEGLAGPRRRDQQHVLARRDRRPGQLLAGRRALGERRLEPGADRLRQERDGAPTSGRCSRPSTRLRVAAFNRREAS